MSEVGMNATDPAPREAGPAARWHGPRHPVHVGHLVMGIAFLGLAGIWAALRTGLADADDLHWLMGLPWVLAGLAGLVAVTWAGRRRRDPSAGPTG